MNDICICLFGRFCAECSGRPIQALSSGKVLELFCYLLLHRDRPQAREILADLLWGDHIPGTQARKNLRQVLWQLNAALDLRPHGISDRLLLVEPSWVYLNPSADLWIDVAEFEVVCASTQGVKGPALDATQAEALRGAVTLYRGDLLEGEYYDWCLLDREHLQNLYLGALDKLMDRCEVHGQYEAALCYGRQILQHDQARECTHRRLMRLHLLAGDRTAALRQYEQCVQLLQRELAVKPAASTIALYERICSDRPAETRSVSRTIEHLKQVQIKLAEAQAELQRQVHELEVSRGD